MYNIWQGTKIGTHHLRLLCPPIPSLHNQKEQAAAVSFRRHKGIPLNRGNLPLTARPAEVSRVHHLGVLSANTGFPCPSWRTFLLCGSGENGGRPSRLRPLHLSGELHFFSFCDNSCV